MVIANVGVLPMPNVASYQFGGAVAVNCDPPGGQSTAIPAQRQRARCALSQCGASGGRALRSRGSATLPYRMRERDQSPDVMP